MMAEKNGSSRVLIVDDDPGIRRMLRLALETEGFEVATAANGLDGLEHVRMQTPDCIVLDLRMPVMDGQTFFHKLREKGYETPVIVLTAFDARGTSRQLGADAYLRKPFAPGMLVRQVRRLTGDET